MMRIPALTARMIRETAQIDYQHLAQLVSKRTRLIAVGGGYAAILWALQHNAWRQALNQSGSSLFKRCSAIKRTVTWTQWL